jgi:hypothetical protein
MNLSPDDFDEPHVRLLPCKIFSYMLFPSNEVRRNLFINSALFDAAAAVAVAANVSMEIRPSALNHFRQKTDIQAMAEAAVEPVIYGAVKAPDAPERAAGELVGELLLMAISHELQEPGSVSLNNVLDYASKYFRPTSKRIAQKTRPTDLKKIWHEHRPAAHLWAAFLSWNAEKKTEWGKSALGDDERLLPAGGEHLCSFLALSETLRMKGEAIKHKNATAAFLPAEVAWRPPGNLLASRVAELGSKIL